MRETQDPRRKARGFTLIELVIVVMIIGILAVLVIPKYRQSVMKAQGIDIATRVEAINVALKEYEADHDSLPTGIEPVGPPPWLVGYLSGNHMRGPSNITWQYSKTAANVHATLIIAAGAGSPEDAQILLAAAAALGSIASVIGGGTSLLVTLTE